MLAVDVYVVVFLQSGKMLALMAITNYLYMKQKQGIVTFSAEFFGLFCNSCYLKQFVYVYFLFWEN